jgi:hypothetical protein
MEREELELVMQDRLEAERKGAGSHRAEGLSPTVNGSSVNPATRPKRTSVLNGSSTFFIFSPRLSWEPLFTPSNSTKPCDQTGALINKPIKT